MLDVKAVLAFPAPDGFLERFARKHSVPGHTLQKEYASSLFEELKKYLLLIASFQLEDPTRRFSPPQAIDLMWHDFISDNTEVYERFCRDNFHIFLHHHAGQFYPREELRGRAIALGVSLNPAIWDAPEGDPDCG